MYLIPNSVAQLISRTFLLTTNEKQHVMKQREAAIKRQLQSYVNKGKGHRNYHYPKKILLENNYNQLFRLFDMRQSKEINCTENPSMQDLEIFQLPKNRTQQKQCILKLWCMIYGYSGLTDEIFSSQISSTRSQELYFSNHRLLE